MFKNRPLMMLLTGVFFALVLWGLVLVAQQGKRSEVKASPTTEMSNIKTSTDTTKSIPISPASVLTIMQSGQDFILSGKGTAGAGLSLMNEDVVVSRTYVDDAGDWGLTFSVGEALPDAMMLNLLMVTPQGYKIRSDQSLVFVPEPKLEKNEAMENTPKKALILLTAPGAHSRVMQTFFNGFPSRDGFALEAIDYDNAGGVIFSGMSLRQGKVRVYANNNLVGASSVDVTGRWSLIFGNIMPVGKYDLTFELVSDTGVKSTKLILPFVRKKSRQEQGKPLGIVAEYHDDYIQIGRMLFGGGYQFTVIYAPIALVP